MQLSKDRLVQQFETQKEELKLWKKKYDEKRREVSKATRDTKTSKLQWFLDKYVQGKESEVNRSKNNSQVVHMKRINKLFNTEIVNFSKSQNLALEMLQTNYYIFLSDNCLDSETSAKYTKLDQMINGTGSVKFDQSVDDTQDENEAPDMSNYEINTDDSVPGVDLNINGKRTLQNSSSGASSDSDTSMESITFKKPRIQIQPAKDTQTNLNETISFAEAHNSTFEVAKMKNSKTDVIRGILSDHSHGVNRNQISKGKNFICKKKRLNFTEENLYYSLKKLLLKSISGEDLTKTIGKFSVIIVSSSKTITRFISNSILKFLVIKVGHVNSLGRII